jgi:hypothetical protein
VGPLLRDRDVRVAPLASRWIAFFYYAAGSVLLWIAGGSESLRGWLVGATFGTGQLLAAAVLYWTLERTGSHPDALVTEDRSGTGTSSSNNETEIDA